MNMKFAWLLLAVLVVALVWVLDHRVSNKAYGEAIVMNATTMPTDPAFGPYLYRKATFAGGCFWGTESAFRHVPGVIATTVGYDRQRIEKSDL